ncbi:MAG: hypothetical protein PHV82_17320 [Victivallaceae bacterium]|nr:hypothetical protein [Victivallaceae bacterium]
MLLTAALVYSGYWLNERRKNAEIIRNAIADPQTIKPEKFLNTIDKSFRKLDAKSKKDILKDPKKVQQYVAKATCRELQKSFKVLFCLPKPVREKIIKDSAERLLKATKKNPQKTAEVFNSAGGRGGLEGASHFFLLYLSGREKAEVAPLTAAIFEVARRQKVQNTKQ